MKLKRHRSSTNFLLAVLTLFFLLPVACKKVAPSAGGPGQAQEQPCTPPASVVLPIDLSRQKTSNWCWAASGEMVMKFLKKGPEQCEQANEEFGHPPAVPSCCDDPEACNRGGWPH